MQPKEFKISMTSEVIGVSADKLWSVIGPGFGEVGSWTSSVEKSIGIGKSEFVDAPCKERTCQVNISGFDQMTETLVNYDTTKRQLAYEVTEGVPGFVLLARNSWAIRSVGENQSVAEMNLTMRLKPVLGALLGGLLKRKALENIETYFIELKEYAETGKAFAPKTQVTPGTTSRSLVIPAPASRVWSVISDYSNIQVFHPFVESVDQLAEIDRGLGASRRCNLYGKPSVTETVVEWDEGRSFVVSSSHQPIVGEVTGGMLVEPIDERTSRVTVDASYSTAWGILGKALDVLLLRVGVGYALNRVRKSLQHHMETGELIGRSGKSVAASATRQLEVTEGNL